jgi:hypothetical protein
LQRIETLQLEPRGEEVNDTKLDDDMIEGDGQPGRSPEYNRGASHTQGQDSAGDSDPSQDDSGISGMENPEPAKRQFAIQKDGQSTPSNEANSPVSFSSKVLVPSIQNSF